MIMDTSSQEVRSTVLDLTGQCDADNVSQSKQSRGRFCDTSGTRHKGTDILCIVSMAISYSENGCFA